MPADELATYLESALDPADILIAIPHEASDTSQADPGNAG
jgi:hypothetical protein